MAAPSKRTLSPAFQFYPKDFLCDEEQELMSLAEAGAYIRLLCRCWLKGSLPEDVGELATLCGATKGQMQKFWPAISKCFKQRPDGRWIHGRLDDERKKQAEYRKKQKDNADRGWQSRRDAMALPSHRSGNALLSSSSSSSPSATPKKNKDSSEASSEPALMEFSTVGELQSWFLFPSHVSKWQADFPNVDILGECHRAHAWIDANHSKRKTARGMPAFLVKWFGRAVDRGVPSVQVVKPPRPAALGPEYTAWECPHVERHWNRGDCRVATNLGRPLKESA